MSKLYKTCAWILIIAVLHLQIPVAAMAAQAINPDRSDGITRNLPEKLATPEENIPKTTNWWLWVLAAVAVGVAAAAGGGGGGGGSTTTAASTGDVAVGW